MMKPDISIAGDKTNGLHDPSYPDAAALAIEGVSHTYGPRKALDDVSFTVAPEALRRCSASTAPARARCFRSSPGYSACKPDVSAFSATISSATRRGAALLGVVFQPRTLDLDLSVTQNLLYHAALHGIHRREARMRSDEVLSRIGLADRAGSKVRDLSGGQMRRLEIARALLHRPRLLLLDEATVGLDVKARAEILGHVRQLVTEQGIGVLWATHLFDEIEPSDDLVILHQGRVLAGRQGRVHRRESRGARPQFRVHAVDRSRSGIRGAAP